LNKPLESGWSQPSPPQTVSFGIPVAEALLESVKRFSAQRVAVISARSISGPGGLAEQVTKALGDKLHTQLVGINPHTPRADVIRVVKALEGADAVVAVGGG
jgi:alcohol dehydrogenase class IV